MSKYKVQFGPEHEGKFIAVAKGTLYGPFDTLEQLKTAQGPEKSSQSFVARIGHEDDPPAKRFNNQRRGGRGRGGRGRGRGGSFNEPRRGDFGFKNQRGQSEPQS